MEWGHQRTFLYRKELIQTLKKAESEERLGLKKEETRVFHPAVMAQGISRYGEEVAGLRAEKELLQRPN